MLSHCLVVRHMGDETSMTWPIVLQLSKLKQQPIAIHLSFEQAQRMHPKSPPQLVNLELG